jgi:hypothetical protein
MEKCVAELHKNSGDILSLVELVKIKERRVLDKQDETLETQKKIIDLLEKIEKKL